jgi:hypothetical protein
MMKLAASLTATGLIGLLLLEALKILLAPVAVWLLGMVMLAVKIALVTFAAGLTLGVSVWAYRRYRRSRQAELMVE